MPPFSADRVGYQWLSPDTVCITYIVSQIFKCQIHNSYVPPSSASKLRELCSSRFKVSNLNLSSVPTESTTYSVQGTPCCVQKGCGPTAMAMLVAFLPVVSKSLTNSNLRQDISLGLQFKGAVCHGREVMAAGSGSRWSCGMCKQEAEGCWACFLLTQSGSPAHGMVPCTLMVGLFSSVQPLQR